MPIMCSVLQAVEPVLAVLAGATVLGPLVALHVLRGAWRRCHGASNHHGRGWQPRPEPPR